LKGKGTTGGRGSAPGRDAKFVVQVGVVKKKRKEGQESTGREKVGNKVGGKKKRVLRKNRGGKRPTHRPPERGEYGSLKREFEDSFNAERGTNKEGFSLKGRYKRGNFKKRKTQKRVAWNSSQKVDSKDQRAGREKFGGA